MYLHIDLFEDDHMVTQHFGGERVVSHHTTYSEVIELIKSFADAYKPLVIPVRLIDRDLNWQKNNLTSLTHESAIKYIHDTRTPFPRYEEFTA